MSKWQPLPLGELARVVYPNGTPPVDPRPILVEWRDMPLTYCGPKGLDWERLVSVYTSKPEYEAEEGDEAEDDTGC